MPENRNHRLSSRRVKASTEQRTQMAQMRAAGATLSEIGRALGLHPTTVRYHILRLLDEVAYEDADRLRTLEGERLDRLQRTIWPEALGGNLRAIDRVLRIMDHRARLFGLYAPVAIDANINNLDDDARELIDQRVAAIQMRRAQVIEVESREGGSAPAS